MSVFSNPFIQNTLQSYIKEVRGLENIPPAGPFIIAVNHNNHLDSFIICSIIQKHANRTVKFLARKDITIWRVIGQWGADRLSAILIDPTKRSESMDIALDALNQGHIIGNYPEAQLNDTDELVAPRSGTARLALWTGLPVIPAGISEGPGAHLGFKLFKDILFSFKNSTKVVFGKALQFERYKEEIIPKELLDQTSDAIMHAIAPLCGKTYTRKADL